MKYFLIIAVLLAGERQEVAIGPFTKGFCEVIVLQIESKRITLNGDSIKPILECREGR